MAPPRPGARGTSEFRSFGDPEPQEQQDDVLTLPMMLLPVQLVIDRDSLARLGYEIAAVVAAAVHDGIRAGIDPDGDTLPPEEESPTPS